MTPDSLGQTEGATDAELNGYGRPDTNGFLHKFRNGRFVDMRIEKDPANLLVMVDLAMDESNRDRPFDTGTVYVLANEHGDLHTYSLTPCRGGK